MAFKYRLVDEIDSYVTTRPNKILYFSTYCAIIKLGRGWNKVKLLNYT